MQVPECPGQPLGPPFSPVAGQRRRNYFVCHRPPLWRRFHSYHPPLLGHGKQYLLQRAIVRFRPFSLTWSLTYSLWSRPPFSRRSRLGSRPPYRRFFASLFFFFLIHAAFECSRGKPAVRFFTSPWSAL